MPEPRAIVPDKGIRPGKNSSGADIAKAVAVRLHPAGTEDPNQISLPLAGNQIYGVTMGIIKNGQIGDVQVEGRCPALAGAGGIAVGTELAVTVAGAFIAAVAGNRVVARGAVAAAAGAYGEVELVGPAQSYIFP